MKLIINVPDDHFDVAMAVALQERRDYARRYDKPGWGWVIHRDCSNFWVSGIKGGISVRLYKSPHPDHRSSALPRDDQNQFPQQEGTGP